MNPTIDLPASPDEELAHSFRKRRLTYSRHHIQDSAQTAAALLAEENLSDDQVQEDVVKQSESSVAHVKQTAASAREKRKHVDAATNEGATNQPTRRHEQKRILHSSEIVKRSSHNHRLSPHRHRKSKWRQRFSFCSTAPDHVLPFPRSVVGTYSCHGMEPVCDSEYDDSDQEEKEEGAVQTVAKINQDRGGIAYPYAHSDKCALFMIYDGHGEGGEMVSQYALGEVQRLLEERLVKLHGFQEKKGMLEKIEEGVTLEEGDGSKDENEERLIKEAFRETFVQVDRGLLNEPDIEPMYSGTTACVALLHHDKLYISNAGDSRAVLARRSTTASKDKTSNNKKDAPPANENSDATTSNTQKSTTPNLTAIPLSIDQNPDSPGEKERILSSGGFVSPPPEPGLSARVWLDAANTQIGLAMARSIGDHAVKDVGVIAEPVVTVHEISEEDEFVILASDGVWEFLDNEDAVRIVSECLYDSDEDAEVCASAACEALIKAAMEKWHESEGDYRDDITAIVVRLKDMWRLH